MKNTFEKLLIRPMRLIYWICTDWCTRVGIIRPDNPEIVIGTNRFGKYCVPKSSRHRSASRTVLNNQVYEPETIKYVMEHCGNGDIIHAGTYFGDFLPAFSQACSPKAKVWAFEPNSENYICAKLTIGLNNLHNIELFHAGLGKKCETRLFKVRDEFGRSLGGKSRIVVKGEKTASKNSESTRIVALDSHIPQNRLISVIQLDVEGHEKEAIEGGLNINRRDRPILILESSVDSNFLKSAWFKSTILTLGYYSKTKVHQNFVFDID